MLRGLFIFFIFSVISAQETEYFQQNVDYNIEVTLNDTNHTLTAFEKLIYSNNSPDTLDFIWFHIWPNAYKDDSTAYAKQAGENSRFAKSDSSERGFIDSLDFSVDGQKVVWENHPDWIDVIKVHLNDPLYPGGSVTIETPFFVKIPLVFSRLGHTGKHYEITQWYPKPAVYDHKGWHPMPYLNQGEFYSEFGSFNVKITLSKNYRIMATGDLVDGEEEYAWLDSLTIIADSIQNMPEKDFENWVKSQSKAESGEKDSDSINLEMKTLHFRQTRVHDFAWFADEKWLVQKGNLSLDDSMRNVTLWSFYLPKNAATWKNSIEYLHDSGYWYSRYYGDYPYNHITAVDGDLSAGGGMEYPNITVIASMPSKQMLEMVIMHEVGHNWFYGILGSNERYHTWMDEGLNEYSCIRYWQDKYKDQNERFVIAPFIQEKLGIAKQLKFSWFEYFQYSILSQIGNPQPLSLKADEFDGGNYGLNYNKTAVFTRFLQHYLGEEKMDEIMQDYYETWKFKHPYPEDIRTVFEKHTNKDLNWYFDGALGTTDYVDFAIEKKGGRYIISNEGELKVPVEVVFFGDSHKILERRWLEGFEWRTTIDPPANVWYAMIDPDEHMPDVDRTNNSTRKETHFHFIWDQPTYYDRDINYIPWLSYNNYNGLPLGMMFFMGMVPGYSYSTSLSPMWDNKNQKIVGRFSHRRKLDSNNWFNESDITYKVAQFEGRSGGRINYSGTMGEDISIGTFSFGINYSRLDSTALDNSIYSSGTYQLLEFGYLHSWRKKRSGNWFSFNSGVKIGNGFSTASLGAKIRLNFTKKIGMKVRLWAGGFLDNKDVPKHFRSYLSGGVDPTFSRFVLDRTGRSGNAIMQYQFIQEGPALRGLTTDENNVPLSSLGFTWGLNIDPSIPLFIDVAGGADFNQTYTAAGLKFGALIMPLYQSWDPEEKTAKNWQWIKQRIRLTFSFDLDELVNFAF